MRIEEVLVLVRDEFAEVSGRARDVLDASEETALLAQSIADLAEQNEQDTAQMDEAGKQLSERIEELRRHISAHDKAANQVAEQSYTVQQAIEEMAAITEETSASTQQVAATVAEQFEGLAELDASARDVHHSALGVREALERFKTSASEEDATLADPALPGSPGMRAAA
jgi:methyl-accepting chemotaxis protein